MSISPRRRRPGRLRNSIGREAAGEKIAVAESDRGGAAEKIV